MDEVYSEFSACNLLDYAVCKNKSVSGSSSGHIIEVNYSFFYQIRFPRRIIDLKKLTSFTLWDCKTKNIFIVEVVDIFRFYYMGINLLVFSSKELL